MQEIYDFLKKCGTYYLATTEGGQPRVRPFGTVDIFEGRLYIQTGKVKMSTDKCLPTPKLKSAHLTADTGCASQLLRYRMTEWKHKNICWTVTLTYRPCISQATEIHRCSI